MNPLFYLIISFFIQLIINSNALAINKLSPSKILAQLPPPLGISGGGVINNQPNSAHVNVNFVCES